MKYAVFALCLMGALNLVEAKDSTTEQVHDYKVIHTNELKGWYDQGKEMTVIDSRSKPYFDGTVMPKAKWLSYEVTDSELNTALPSKNALIVVYCWSPGCPASKYMTDRLMKAGYTNVYKYPEGIQEWMQKNYPTEKH